MKKKNEFVVERNSFYADIGRLVENGDYAGWFTDHIAKDCIAFLPWKYGSTKDPQERFVLAMQADKARQLYSMLVYYAYPNRPEFREKIDSDRELSANFKMVKEWLDRNQGKAAIDYDFRYMKGEGRA
ncbi:MAG: hypothetical protein NTX79_08710 [Candidatus Micrarchaeota archaeon]|nr:hypothetical protein [Candidatus Micrarchaeota archaeon]